MRGVTFPILGQTPPVEDIVMHLCFSSCLAPTQKHWKVLLPPKMMLDKIATFPSLVSLFTLINVLPCKKNKHTNDDGNINDNYNNYNCNNNIVCYFFLDYLSLLSLFTTRGISSPYLNSAFLFYFFIIFCIEKMF